MEICHCQTQTWDDKIKKKKKKPLDESIRPMSADYCGGRKKKSVTRWGIRSRMGIMGCPNDSTYIIRRIPIIYHVCS